jgi:hypothetical protein
MESRRTDSIVCENDVHNTFFRPWVEASFAALEA